MQFVTVSYRFRAAVSARPRTCAARGCGVGLAARGKNPAAFERRCIRCHGVAPRSHTAGLLSRPAWLHRRMVVLGATRGLATDCLGSPRSGSMARDNARPGVAEWGLGVPAQQPRGVRGEAPG